MSPSAKKTYGIQRVCRAWRLARATVQRHKAQACAEPRIMAACEHHLLACSRPVGVRAALRGTRFEAMECLREAIRAVKGRYDTNIAKGTKLRHDHGTQFISHAFRDDLKTAGIESSPSFVRQPEGNGCVERFIRTLKEQLLWLQPVPRCR